MAKIEISDPVYRRLLRRSVAFEDTAEGVIQRLLDETDSHEASNAAVKTALKRRISRAAPGSILPEREYWKPILRIIVEAGGSAAASEVIESLEEQLKDSLTSQDLEPLEAGEVRWRNRARFARLRMTQQGLLSDSSHRGIWEITEAGRRYLESD